MKPFCVALAGLGTVGGGVGQLLQTNANVIAARAGRELKLVAVSARDRSKARAMDLDSIAWEPSALALAERPDVDAIVEVIGGAEGIARALCEKALANGKTIVTANKALLATHGERLAQLAEDNGATLCFEAAVCGGIPIIKTMREALAGNRITRVQGLLNGTCNFILTRMSHDGMAFDEALDLAQKRGFAEADPTADVDGLDARHKLALLSTLAFGVRPIVDSISLEGIRRLTPLDFELADNLGFSIKLLGFAQRTAQGLEQRVSPCLVPLSSPLASVDDEVNAVEIDGDAVGPLTLIGRGAGAAATASAIVGDLIDCARGMAGLPWGVPTKDLSEMKALSAEEQKSRWYIRLDVQDRAGVLAELADILRDEDLSVETLWQQARSAAQEPVPVMIVTHEASAAALARAVVRFAALGAVRTPPLALRIEPEL